MHGWTNIDFMVYWKKIESILVEKIWLQNFANTLNPNCDIQLGQCLNLVFFIHMLPGLLLHSPAVQLHVELHWIRDQILPPFYSEGSQPYRFYEEVGLLEKPVLSLGLGFGKECLKCWYLRLGTKKNQVSFFTNVFWCIILSWTSYDKCGNAN